MVMSLLFGGISLLVLAAYIALAFVVGTTTYALGWHDDAQLAAEFAWGAVGSGLLYGLVAQMIRLWGALER